MHKETKGKFYVKSQQINKILQSMPTKNADYMT